MRRRINSAILALGVFACLPPAAFSRPEFLMRFASDPFSRPEMRTGCSTCHINPAGGGTRNEFGMAFARNGFRVTPALRLKWPDRFVPTLTAQAAGLPKATWSAAKEDEVLVEIAGEQYLLNRADGSVKKVDAAQAQAFLTAPAPPPSEADAPVQVAAKPTFDYYLVNLPTNRVRAPRSLHLRFTHRFSQPLFTGTGRLRDLFGFDGFAVSSFGVELGLTKRVSFMTYRSPYPLSVGGPTIELGPIFNLLQQGENAPVSLSFRTTIEGEQNFTERYTTNLAPVLSYAVRDWAEFFLVPTFSLGVPRRTLTSDFAFSPGELRNHQVSIGLGGSLRIRPKVALVGEWRPRVAGFRTLGSRNPYGFAIQRATDRHVFALVVSNSLSTTTTRSISDAVAAHRADVCVAPVLIQCLDDFRIGFNLYRRIW